MLKLIQSGLMYGGLFEVGTPTLVSRYNRALEKLTGRTTKLDSFHIDLSGYAPEIGEELEDENYLNPHGCNRQFILLSMDQMRAPLLNANFSNSRAILQQFFEDNADALFSLTSRQPVIGELLNSIYRVTSVDQILELRSVSVDAETVSGHLASQKELEALTDRFLTEPDAWYDDVLILQMTELAADVGDIKREPIDISPGPYGVGDFHTLHMGGLYVFRIHGATTVIHAGPRPETSLNCRFLSLEDTEAVAAFLRDNNLAESIFGASGVDPLTLLRQRVEFVLVDHFARTMPGWSYTGPVDLRSLAYRDIAEVPELFHALSDRIRRMEQGGTQRPLDPGQPDLFYCLRATQGASTALVNRLLAELTSVDTRQLYICHKNAFYSAYRTWPEAKQDHAVSVLKRDYLPDRQGARARLYGPKQDESSAVWPMSRGPWANTMRSG